MKVDIQSVPRFDEEVAGMPVEAHGYIVTPYARMRGMAGEQDDEQASGRYGWATIRPVRMTVQDLSGEVREVRLVDVQGQALKALAVIGALMALVSVFTRPVRFRPPTKLAQPDRSISDRR